MTRSQHDFVDTLRAAKESRQRQLALVAVANCYRGSHRPRRQQRDDLLAAARPAYATLLRGEYGSVIVVWLLLAVAGAVLSWAVERFLDWLFASGDGFADELRSAHVVQLRDRWRRGL